MPTDALRWKASFKIRHHFQHLRDEEMGLEDAIPEGIVEPVSKAVIEFAKLHGDERLERYGEDIGEAECVGEFNACLDLIYDHCDEMRWLVQ